jgi:uncharacterized caspase-like protein
MKKAVRAFGEKIRAGGVGLFYYAGHAIQVGGRNYLIPGRRNSYRTEVEYEGVAVGLVLAQMYDAGLNIVILHACRDNRFAMSLPVRKRRSSIHRCPQWDIDCLRDCARALFLALFSCQNAITMSWHRGL